MIDVADPHVTTIACQSFPQCELGELAAASESQAKTKTKKKKLPSVDAKISLAPYSCSREQTQLHICTTRQIQNINALLLLTGSRDWALGWVRDVLMEDYRRRARQLTHGR